MCVYSGEYISSEFARGGVVVQEKGGVRITDRAGLERIAADTR